MNVSDAIRLKRAVRNFTDQPLAVADVRAILNAGRRAQSSKNSQAWNFVAVQRRETLAALGQCGPWAGHLAGAALGVVILTPDPAQRFQILFDAGQAAAYMQLAAWELGIGSCMATLYEGDQVREILGFPTEWQARFAISFGYPAETEKLAAPPKKGGRQPLEDLVHWDTW
jgi:nitroreductase